MFFLAVGNARSSGADTAVIASTLRDTSRVETIRPGSEKESEVFSDRGLKYRRQVDTGPDLLKSLLQALAPFLFDNADAEDLYKTRQLIIWTVVIISAFVIVRLLLRSNIAGLTRTGTRATGFNFNDLTEDLHAINYEQRVAEALAEKDYRLAIRWHYLEMLYELDKKQLIVFSPHKTNIDYRYELKDQKTQSAFFSLSRIYDYVWYGQFVISETDYFNNAGAFLNLKKNLNV